MTDAKSLLRSKVQNLSITHVYRLVLVDRANCKTAKLGAWLRQSSPFLLWSTHPQPFCARFFVAHENTNAWARTKILTTLPEGVALSCLLTRRTNIPPRSGCSTPGGSLPRHRKPRPRSACRRKSASRLLTPHEQVQKPGTEREDLFSETGMGGGKTVCLWRDRGERLLPHRAGRTQQVFHEALRPTNDSFPYGDCELDRSTTSPVLIVTSTAASSPVTPGSRRKTRTEFVLVIVPTKL